MKNLYPQNVPLTAALLTQQEQRRDDALSAVLRAVLETPGVIEGHEITADSDVVTVGAGVSVWPDADGVWRLVQMPTPQRLTLPAEGEWLVMLNAEANVWTQPMTLPERGETVYLASERLAYAPGANPADTQLLLPGLTLEAPTTNVRGLVLASVSITGGEVEVTADPPRAQARVQLPSQDELVESVLAALPEQPKAEDIEAAVLEKLPTPPSRDDLIVDVLAALPEQPKAEDIEAAVLEKLPKPEVVAQARAYTVSEHKPLSATLPAPVLSRFTLPAAPPEHATLIFNGRGAVVSVEGTRALLRPELEEALDPLHPWAFSDPGLVVGDVLGINGPNAGFYVSTFSPVRNPETKSQDRTTTGLLRWQHVLQRYTPDTPIPVTVVDSQQVEVPADTVPTPLPLTTLNEALMWGARPQPFPVHQDVGNPQANVISPIVNGRKLKAVNITGITTTRLTLVLDGTLLVVPLSEAPTPLREGAGA